MSHGDRFVSAVLLASGIGLAVASPGVAKAAEPHSRDLIPATVVLRGSATHAGQTSSATIGDPVVLRGSPARTASAPAAGNACLPGYDYNPGYGCVTSDYGFVPYDYGYGYWPYWGFDGFLSGGQRRRFRQPFLRRHGFAVRFGLLSPKGFGHGFSHFGGLSRR